MPDGIKVFQEYAKDYILKNTGLKVLALLITAVLWLSVASRLSQVIFPSVPIDLVKLSPGLTISKYDQASAKVFLRGPKDVIDSLRSSGLAVVADLENVEPGVRVISLKIDLNRLPPSIDEESIDIEPRTLRVTVEPLIEKELSISPRLAGELPPGYEMYGTVLSQETIRVQAAASSLQEVKEVSTETVNIAGKTETFSQLVAIDTGLPSITTVEENQKVMLTVTIGEARKERVFDRVAVSLINAPANIQWQPKTTRVTVLGGRSLIDSLTPEEILAVADYTAIDSATGEIKIDVKLPSYGERFTVKAVAPSTIRVK